MDYGSRIGKVEAQVESNQRDTDRLYELIVQKFESVELSIRELRRDTEHSISDLRKHNDQQFAELRREITVNMRWTVGLWMSTIGLIAGLAGKVFGMY